MMTTTIVMTTSPLKPKPEQAFTTLVLIDLIKNERIRQGLTVNKLAQRTSYGRTSVLAFEQGYQRSISVEFATELLGALGLDWCDFAKALAAKS